MRRFLARRRHDESGQGLLEYTLVLALVSVMAIGALNALGASLVANYFSLATDAFK